MKWASSHSWDLVFLTILAVVAPTAYAIDGIGPLVSGLVAGLLGGIIGLVRARVLGGILVGVIWGVSAAVLASLVTDGGTDLGPGAVGILLWCLAFGLCVGFGAGLVRLLERNRGKWFILAALLGLLAGLDHGFTLGWPSGLLGGAGALFGLLFGSCLGNGLRSCLTVRGLWPDPGSERGEVGAVPDSPENG